MKKTLILLVTAVLALALLTGCQAADPNEDENLDNNTEQNQPSTDVSDDNNNQPTEDEENKDEETTTSALRPGVWLASGGSSGDQYYFFDSGSNSGRTASLETGMGQAFSYELNGDQAVFHFGGADNNTSCTVGYDADNLIFKWADGSSESLSYVSRQSSDEFKFYSNNDLCQMALRYYAAQNGGANPNLTAAAENNDDGTVTIQLYENLGDHNSTAAWYTIFRHSAQGTDASGQSVDLSAYQN